MHEVFLLLSSLLQVVANVPYITSIFRGSVRPQRTTWLIWLVLTGIAFFSQASSGADTSLFFLGLSAVNCLIVYLLSLWRGVGGWGRADRLSLAAAGLGLGLWYATSDPFASTLITTCIDAAGCLLTLRKAWNAPHTESASAFLISGAGAGLAVASERQIVLQAVFFTLYLVVMNAVIVLILLARRRRLALQAPA